MLISITIIVAIIVYAISVRRAHKHGQSQVIDILLSKYLTENETEVIIEKMEKDISSLYHSIDSNNNAGFSSDNWKIEEEKGRLEMIKKMLENFKENNK